MRQRTVPKWRLNTQVHRVRITGDKQVSDDIRSDIGGPVGIGFSVHGGVLRAGSKKDENRKGKSVHTPSIAEASP
jgi:hypothetical protein